METKTNLIHSEYKLSVGSLDSILSYVNRPVTSPLLVQKAKDEILKPVAEPIKKLFGFGSKPTTEQLNSQQPKDLSNLTEEKVNAELNELGEDDYKDMSGFLLSAFDFGLEKVFNNFFNRKQSVETQAQKEKLTRLKIVLTKVMLKHGVKFKIELLAIMLLVGYTANRYNSAVPITDKDVKKKEDEKPIAKKDIPKSVLTKEQEHDDLMNRLAKIKETVAKGQKEKRKSVLEIVSNDETKTETQN